ncbi:MAG: protein kinase, partial [Deltaproteobacteria bacterium]|nr:protein kinase [Deltaproteobacteria bacterium]
MHMVRCLICQSPIPDGADACGVCVTDDLIGLVLKDMYELVEKIGEGNSGEVYRAIHLGLERPVAVKVLRTILEIDGKRVERFKREAHVVSRLNYPHIVSMIDFGRAEYDGIDLY